MNAPLADAELARLLSLAAHEVRNPLSTILGFIKIVLNRGEIPPQHREWLQTAVNSCGRLTDVANQLSDYARLVSGDTKLNRARTDLPAVLRETIDALPVFADREVSVELGATGPATLQADRVWLKRAITAIIDALRREVGSTNTLHVHQENGEYQGKPAAWILIGDDDQLNVLRQQPKDSLGWFDDKERGNLGVTIWIAKWVLNAHGGGLWAPVTGAKGSGGIITLPTL
jgi:signal transduction histidine kinase